MEVKPKICFEYKKEDRIYRLDIPHAAPLGECYDACFAFIEELLERIKANTERAKPQAPVEEKDEEEKDEKKD